MIVNYLNNYLKGGNATKNDAYNVVKQIVSYWYVVLSDGAYSYHFSIFICTEQRDKRGGFSDNDL